MGSKTPYVLGALGLAGFGLYLYSKNSATASAAPAAEAASNASTNTASSPLAGAAASLPILSASDKSRLQDIFAQNIALKQTATPGLYSAAALESGSQSALSQLQGALAAGMGVLVNPQSGQVWIGDAATLSGLTSDALQGFMVFFSPGEMLTMLPSGGLFGGQAVAAPPTPALAPIAEMSDADKEALFRLMLGRWYSTDSAGPIFRFGSDAEMQANPPISPPAGTSSWSMFLDANTSKAATPGGYTTSSAGSSPTYIAPTDAVPGLYVLVANGISPPVFRFASGQEVLNNAFGDGYSWSVFLRPDEGAAFQNSIAAGPAPSGAGGATPPAPSAGPPMSISPVAPMKVSPLSTSSSPSILTATVMPSSASASSPIGSLPLATKKLVTSTSGGGKTKLRKKANR